MKIYETILNEYAASFNAKSTKAIKDMLENEPDNKYLTMVVMLPFMDKKNDFNTNYRKARKNYLVFKDEVANSNGPFARQINDNEIETPLNRLSHFFDGLTADSLIAQVLIKAELGIRKRKQLISNDEYTAQVDEVINSVNQDQHSKEEIDVILELADYPNPTPGFWWTESPIEVLDEKVV